MLYIKNLEEALPVFKALGSELRIRIVMLLLEHGELNMNELASLLGITNGALTSHIKRLEESGVVKIISDHAGHGNQKVCRVNVNKILVDVHTPHKVSVDNSYSIDIPVGNYSDYHVFPTCGLSTSKNLIGVVDDPRYFAHPERVDAEILWFSKGYVEYRIPNMLPVGHKAEKITMSFEIGSEAPGSNNDWPSDITFFLNKQKLGTWTSPGDFADIHGMFTPDWWFSNWNQHGLLKILEVDSTGTYIDGLKISDVTTSDLSISSQDSLTFRFQVDEPSQNIGGLTLYGKEFGNYNQDIKVRIHFAPVASASE